MIKDDLCSVMFAFIGNHGKQTGEISLDLPRPMYEEVVQDIINLCEKCETFDAILESERETKDD